MGRRGGIVDFTYNDEGIRTSKNGIHYTLVDGKVTAEEANNEWIYYRYDEAGELVSLNWEDNEYFYVKNIQGDIIGLVDEDGVLVVEYEYDAWGKLLRITGSMSGALGIANPFRYRSYYYDIETGLYYCQSRYYNPEWGRWINADVEVDTDSLMGANIFAYCENNPVNHSDPSGQSLSETIRKAILTKKNPKKYTLMDLLYARKAELLGLLIPPESYSPTGKWTAKDLNDFIAFEGGQKLSWTGCTKKLLDAKATFEKS